MHKWTKYTDACITTGWEIKGFHFAYVYAIYCEYLGI
jgi:hypothetical protein